VEAALGRGQPRADEGAVVREDGGHRVAPPQAQRLQAAGDGARMLEQLPIAEHPTVGVDDRDPPGIGGRDAPEAEPGAVHEKSEYYFLRMGDEFREQLRARFAEHHPGPPPKGRDARLAW